MEQFLQAVKDYAEADGVQPSTVLQRAAGLSGAVWRKWEEGKGSPTLKTADRILDYMRENPPRSPVQGSAA